MENMLCVCCPVCTLYLREGVSLQEHLNTHPKEQVIEALVRYSGVYSAEGPSKHYHEFAAAFPRAAAAMAYPVYPPAPAPDVPQLKCGADCVSCSHYAPHKQQVIKVDNVYEREEGIHRIWTTPPEAEEPTNLCLRQSGNPPPQDDNGTRGVPWVPQAYQTENGQAYEPRHFVHNGQILRNGGGTIIEAGEGRTLLNLSEPGPMSVLELEGIHFLVPSQFLGHPSTTATAQLAKPDVGVAPEASVSTATVPVTMPATMPTTMPATTTASPTVAVAYPKRSWSPNLDMEVAESPCSAADSAPSSPFVKRPESPINIRSDETMPAHGEISEQESVGGNSSSMWPDQNFSSLKEQSYYEMYKPSEAPDSYEESATKFVPQSVSFSSSLPPSAPLPLPLPLPCSAPPPRSDEVQVKDKKPARVPKCRWCRMTFSRPAERRAHLCDKKKRKDPLAVPSTSETVIQVQKPKRVYKRKTKENAVDIRLDQFADVLVNKVESEVDNKGAVVAVEEAHLVQASHLVGAPHLVQPPLLGKAPHLVEPLKSFKCEKCDEEFSSYRLMASHRNREHKGSRYECATCSETFELEAQYHSHLVVHPLECKLCGKFFYRRQNMALHMKRHMSVKPYKCEHCDKSFVTKQKLDEHSNIHTGKAPIKCPLCDETFRRHSNLVQHKNRHHINVKQKKKDFICHCGEVFHTKKKLEWHKEIHDEKPKACSFCNERFVHASSLTRHVRKAHDQRYVPKVGREVENVQCPICHTVFLKTSLAVHMRTHSGARPYPCHICGKKFTTKWNLQLHRWTHASRSTKPFKCSMCKSAFYRRSDFTSHMRSHRNVRPYTCNHCGCQFIRKYNCIRHMNEHEKAKSYSCTICDKTFHRSYYLKEHMRVHSKTRPYSCHICGKASSSKSNHNKHVKIHHAREPQNTEG